MFTCAVCFGKKHLTNELTTNNQHNATYIHSHHRISFREALDHPFFWDPDKRLSFLQDVSDRVESEDEFGRLRCVCTCQSVCTYSQCVHPVIVYLLLCFPLQSDTWFYGFIYDVDYNQCVYICVYVIILYCGGVCVCILLISERS